MSKFQYEQQTKKQAKREFLINVYNQSFTNINRHITIVWQSVSVLVASFVSIIFTEKYNISIYPSYILLSIYITWMIAHLLDSNTWYRRNIHIITNVERYFLSKKDKKKLHYFFASHLEPKKIIDTFLIQIYFALIVWFISLSYVFYKATIEVNLVYFWVSLSFTMLCICMLHTYYKKNIENIKKLLVESPGLNIKD